MKNNDEKKYAGTPTPVLLAAGDCCRSDQCERCFLCEEKRCTDILVALLTDRLYLCSGVEKRKRDRERRE